MENLFKPIYLDISKKYRTLTSEAQGKVKSTKYFPVFLFDEEEYIFKPLSKTKPLTTPLFAYSEVYWSYIINKYFDSRAPIYHLAYCKGVGKDQPKYYEQGVLVKSVLKKGQTLINLLEYFNEFKEEKVDISNYTNYCMQIYDYTSILDSNFVKNNKLLGKQLAEQILLALLRQDQNFHYENVNYVKDENGIVEIAPPLDFEFSNMFLYPDNDTEQKREKTKYLETIDFIDDYSEFLEQFSKNDQKIIISLLTTNIRNIAKIVEYYPDMAEEFLKKLESLLNEIDTINLSDNYEYIGACNTNTWYIGHARYKQNDEQMAKEYEKIIKPIQLDKERLFDRIKKDVKENIERMQLILRAYLQLSKKGITDLDKITKTDVCKIFKSDSIEDIKSLKKVTKID